MLEGITAEVSNLFSSEGYFDKMNMAESFSPALIVMEINIMLLLAAQCKHSKGSTKFVGRKIRERMDRAGCWI